MKNIFDSQVFQFSSEFNSGVSPRTGAYIMRVPLASLTGNNGMGPEFSLELIYNSMNDRMSIYGNGVIDNTSRYIRTTKRLILSDGRMLTLKESSTKQLVFNSPEPTDLKLEHDLKKKALRIFHNSGLIEDFSLTQETEDVFPVIAMSNALGYSLLFNWRKRGGEWVLQSISDNTETLLSLNPTFPDALVFSILSEKKEVTLHKFNDYLTSVRHSDSLPKAWLFRYSNLKFKNKYLINEISSPSGITETIVFTQSGHKLLRGSPGSASVTDTLPRVIFLQVYDEDNTHFVHKLYEYDENNHNFTGYGGKQAFVNIEGEDDIYSVEEGYQYSMTETERKDEDIDIVKKVTFNKLHQLVSVLESYSNLDKVNEKDGISTYNKIVAYTYFSDLKLPVSTQSSIYNNIKDIVTEWNYNTYSKNNTRTEVESFTYNTDGNLVLKIGINGAKTEYEYYPVSGETVIVNGAPTILCPKSPHGFRFLKSFASVPATSEYDTPERKHHFKYSQLPVKNEDAAGAKYIILPASRLIYNRLTGEETLRREYDYVNDFSVFHGSLKNETITIGTKLKCKNTYDKSIANNTHLVLIKTTTTADNLSLATQTVIDLSSLKVKSTTDAFLNTLSYEYNDSGLLTSRTLNKGTPYVNTLEFTYNYFGNHKGAYLVANMFDQVGNAMSFEYDRYGDNILKTYQSNRMDAEFIIEEMKYDTNHNVIKENSFDLLNPEEQSVSKRSITSRETRVNLYGWNDSSSAITENNVTVNNFIDKVLLTATELTYLQDNPSKMLSKKTTEYDVNGNPLRLKIYDMTTGKADIDSQMIEYKYDGLGRVKNKINAGYSEQYKYDDLDRITEVTYPNGDKVLYTYMLDFESAITITAVNGASGEKTIIGESLLDGLGRTIRQKSGGRTIVYAYNENFPVPSSKTDEGGTLKYEYIPELNFALKSIRSGGNKLLQEFIYEPSTGQLKKTVDYLSGIEQTFAYNAVGQLIESNVTDGSKKTLPSRFTSEFSLAGRTIGSVKKDSVYDEVTTLQNVYIKNESHEYSAVGDLIKWKDNFSEVSFKYDEWGRPQSTLLKPVGSQMYSAETVLTHDFLGNETNRVIKSYNNGKFEKDIMRMSYAYDVMNRVIRKTTKFNNKDESVSYFYDKNSRLSHVINSDPDYSESFSWDFLDNPVLKITGTEHLSRYEFSYNNKDDKSQLTSYKLITEGGSKKIDLGYDTSGRMISNGKGDSLTYDPLSRLSSVNGKMYFYDAFNRLAGTSSFQYSYFNNTVSSQYDRTSGTYLQRGSVTGESTYTKEFNRSYEDLSVQFSDQQGSTVLQTGYQLAVTARNTYDSFGYQYTRPNMKAPQFAGEYIAPHWKDDTNQIYIFGNGYRYYIPELMRFNIADNNSPFGDGGLNAYTYCGGDPVNNTDPSGHIKVSLDVSNEEYNNASWLGKLMIGFRKESDVYAYRRFEWWQQLLLGLAEAPSVLLDMWGNRPGSRLPSPGVKSISRSGPVKWGVVTGVNVVDESKLKYVQYAPNMIEERFTGGIKIFSDVKNRLNITGHGGTGHIATLDDIFDVFHTGPDGRVNQVSGFTKKFYASDIVSKVNHHYPGGLAQFKSARIVTCCSADTDANYPVSLAQDFANRTGLNTTGYHGAVFSTDVRGVEVGKNFKVYTNLISYLFDYPSKALDFDFHYSARTFVPSVP